MKKFKNGSSNHSSNNNTGKQKKRIVQKSHTTKVTFGGDAEELMCLFVALC